MRCLHQHPIQKEDNMDSEVKFRLDNATLRRTADGVVTINKGGSCLTMGLIVCAVAGALSGLWFTLDAVKYIGNENAGGSIVFGLFVTALLGSSAYYLFANSRKGQITITPILNMVTFGKRYVPFSEIADIVAVENPILMMDGVVAVEFLLLLASGEKLELGRKAMGQQESEKILKLETEIVSLLQDVIKKNANLISAGGTQNFPRP